MGSGVLVLAGGWSLGILLLGVLQLPAMIAGLGAAASLCAAMLTPNARVRLAALGVLALLLGQARGAISAQVTGPDPLAAHAGEIVVRGRAVDAPVPRGRRSEVVLDVEAISPLVMPRAFEPLDGPLPRVLVRAVTIPASCPENGSLTAPSTQDQATFSRVTLLPRRSSLRTSCCSMDSGVRRSKKSGPRSV